MADTTCVAGSMLVAGGYANPTLPCEIPIPDEVFRQEAASQVKTPGREKWH